MNYLAHFYLAFGNRDQLIGQFIADTVRGKHYDSYPYDIKNGILVHRLIDGMTDHHAACQELRAALRPTAGLLSPVGVDMLLDHVLAKHWSQWHEQPLQEFAQQCYTIFDEARTFLPERMQYILKYMSAYDWLSNYRHVSGIQRSMKGLSNRITNGKPLATVAEHIENHLPLAEKCFETYFPELIAACKVKISTFAPDNTRFLP